MSITKFLRILLNESGMDGMYQFAPGERHVELVAAQAQIARLVAAYDALAPDWSQAPEWAQWYTIDADRSVHFHENEPSDPHRWCTTAPTPALDSSPAQGHRRRRLNVQSALAPPPTRRGARLVRIDTCRPCRTR